MIFDACIKVSWRNEQPLQLFMYHTGDGHRLHATVLLNVQWCGGILSTSLGVRKDILLLQDTLVNTTAILMLLLPVSPPLRLLSSKGSYREKLCSLLRLCQQRWPAVYPVAAMF